MKKRLLIRSCAVVVGGLILIHGAEAQSLASAHRTSPTTTYRADAPPRSLQQSLAEALEDLQDRYQVLFSYEPDVVKGKRVTIPVASAKEADLATRLADYLAPWRLEYRKLNDHYYVIFRPNASSVTNVTTLSATPSPLAMPPSSGSQEGLQLPNQSLSGVAVSVSGTVTDAETDEPLPGVNVLVKGTTTGTVTDVEGNFRLDVPSEESVLVFSSIGYVSAERPLNGQTALDVALAPDVSQLEEIVVVGFGERKKKDLTGSIATVDSRAIEQVPQASPQFALQGNAAGVRVVNTSGDPNEAPRVFVRGIGTWNGDSQPLYVIDGQIIEPPRAGNVDEISGFGLETPPNLFNLINSNDIASITVLKDASAAAIYGSRGANGVILLTTKTGKAGPPSVQINARAGVQNIPTFDVLNTQQYVDLAEEMYANNANPDVTIEQLVYGRDEPGDATRLTAFSPQFDPESPFYISDRTTYNWQDELVRQNAINQAYDLNISGGTEAINYYISGGFFNQEGMLRGNELKRYTGSVNLNANVTDWLKLGINYKYTQQNSELNDRGRLPDFAGAVPWQPLRDPNNRYGYAEVLNPFAFSPNWTQAKRYGQGSSSNYLALGDLDYRSFTIDRQLGQFYAQVTPLEGLTLRGSLNFDYATQDRYTLDVWSRSNIFEPNANDPATEAPDAPNSLGGINHRINNIFNFQSDFTATYQRIFADRHNVTFTAAVQDQRHRRERINVDGDNLQFINPDDPKLNGYQNDLANNSSIYGWDQRFWFGLVGRINYDYDSKYYIDGSFRRDASNGFDDDYRWGNFYSVAGAWRISAEPFLENLSWLNDLKLRGGWGEAGNDQAAVGSYAFLSSTAAVSSYRWGSGNGDAIGNYIGGTRVADLPNPTLTWEVVTTTYAGFDALMLDNRLNLTVEVYQRATDGILQRVNLPYSVGTLSPLLNIGEVQNRGIDVQLGYRGQVGDFTYGMSGNVSVINNEVTNLYEGQPITTDEFGRVEEGRPVGHLWGYQVGGIFQNQAEIDAYYAEQEDQTVGNTDYVAPGDLYFVDAGGNPTEEEPFYSTTPDGLINSFDQTQIGTTIPGYTYGLNLNVGWKGLDLAMSFYGEGDVQKRNTVRERFEGMRSVNTNQFTSTLDRWTPQNTDTDLPRAAANDPAGNNRFSTRWVEDASFFRLNTWQLGYTLPASLLDKLNNTVSSLRVYVGGQNNIYLFSWSGIDPVNDNFPLPRAFNAGLTMRF